MTLRVFISSTYVDLVDYRKRAAEAVDCLDQLSVQMEEFGSRSTSPTNTSLEEVEKCDVFVGIYAHRYGYIPPGSESSITKMEFDRAQQLKKLTLCFVIDPDYNWPPKYIEREPGRTMLEKFKEEIGTDLVRETFTTPEDLASKVGISLARYLLREHRNLESELNSFCQRAEGYWWSFGADPGAVSFVTLAPDKKASTISISGNTYDKNYNFLNAWESAASCIYHSKRKFYYYWQGWWYQKMGTHEGFGEISFDDAAGSFLSGRGTYMDSNLIDSESLIRKWSIYRRCIQQEIEVMQGDSKETKVALLQNILKVEKD